MKADNGKRKAALTAYINAITLYLLHDDLKVSDGIIERMISFAMKHHKGHLVEQWLIGKAIGKIRDPHVKHSFIYRHIFLTDDNRKSMFSVYDEASAELAERIMSEFPEDHFLAQKLESLVYKYRLEQAHRSQTTNPHWSLGVLKD